MTKKKPLYVKAQITKTLIELMKVDSYKDITILEIVQNAQVSRSSFYRNFIDKEDILRQHLNTLITDWKNDFDAIPNQDFGESLLTHFYNNQELYFLLYRSELSYLVYENIKKACGLNPKQANISSYITGWFAGAIFGWIDEWILRGMQENPSELVELLKEHSSKM